MKRSTLLLTLIIVWIVFILWEIEVGEWIRESGEMRLDLLIVLPGLVLISFYVLKELYNNAKYKNDDKQNP